MKPLATFSPQPIDRPGRRSRTLSFVYTALVIFAGVCLVLERTGTRFTGTLGMAVFIVALFGIGIAHLVALSTVANLWSFAVGIALGFRPYSLTLGPLLLAREHRGWRVRVNTVGSWYTLTLLPRHERRLRARLLAWWILTPAVGLVFIAFALAVIPERGLLASVWNLLCFNAPAVGLFTIINAVRSSRPNHMMNIRDRVAMLMKGGIESERWCAQWSIEGRSYRGQRPRDWSQELLRRCVALPDSSVDAMGGVLLMYWHALDMHDGGVAEWYLSHALTIQEAATTAQRRTLYMEVAYFLAYWRGDAAAARPFYEAAKHAPSTATQLRAEAAILVTEGNRSSAWQRAVEGRGLLDRELDAGAAQAEGEWLAAIMARAIGATASPHPRRDRRGPRGDEGASPSAALRPRSRPRSPGRSLFILCQEGGGATA